jgi:hypothetical protein
MSKKKKSKKNKGFEPEIKTFSDALRLIFSNTVPKDGVVGVKLEVIPEETDSSETSRYEDIRNDIFEAMTEQELEAYDLIDNFINSGNAGLPEDDDSLEARIEHAEWNIEAYRSELVHILAEFEAAIAYYATVTVNSPDKELVVGEELEEIQSCLNTIRFHGRELERLLKIEEAEFKMDQASVMMNDAYEEREILEEQLEALYAEYEENETEEAGDEVENEELEVEIDEILTEPGTGFILVGTPTTPEEN